MPPKKRKGAQPDLEGEFLEKWLFYYPSIIPERQYKWHPDRRYRADFFFKPNILVEIMGTRSYKSAHTTVTGYHSDCIRMCQAQALGYRILYIDSMFDKDWRLAVDLVKGVIDGK